MTIKKKAMFPLFIVSSILTACLMGGCLDDDRDGDGLPNGVEKEGWPILVTPLGETNRTEIHVSSDPDKYDTDGDGLSDWEEFLSYHTNPREKDTDKDTLTDWEEIKMFMTDPNGGFHDIDTDLFWDGEEVLFFRDQGFDDDTIRGFLNTTDIDGDGTIDGRDKDPLQDLRILIHLQSINISTVDNDGTPGVWEIYFRITGDSTIDIITDTMSIPKGSEYNLNLTWELNLSDEGKPGVAIHLLQIVTWDADATQDDLVKVNNASGFWGTDEFNISLDTGEYRLEGEDGTLRFVIEDASIPWPGAAHH